MTAVWRWLALPVVMRITRIAIGLVFVTAALGKIADLPWFAQQVHNFRLTPGWAENALAMTLPWIELLAGLALVLGVRPRAGAAIAFVLMLAFTVAVGIAWARGLDFRCGCFGKAGAGTIGAAKFLENLGLSALAGLALRRRADTTP
jgi:uncharacterized membrane protein YphA (DoxX/SURF4 family)